MEADPIRALTDADDGARVTLRVSWELDGARVAYDVDLARGCAVRFPAGRGQLDATVIGPVAWQVRATSAIGTTPAVARPFIVSYGIDDDLASVPVAPGCSEAILYATPSASPAFGTMLADLRAASPIDATLASVYVVAGFEPPRLYALPNQQTWSVAPRARNTRLALVQFLGA